MGLEDGGAAVGIVQLVVGVEALLLVFDEPLGSVKFAHVVIHGPGAHQVEIGANRAGSLLRQASDHQGVLKRARRLTGKAPQQGPFQVGQFQQPGAGNQSKETLHQRGEQQAHHQQPPHQQRLAEQLNRGDAGLRSRQQGQLRQRQLQQESADGQDHRQLQKFGPAALTTGHHGGNGRNGAAQQKALGHHGGEWPPPEQGGAGQPGQATNHAEPLGQQQGGGHQQYQRTGQRAQPQAHRLHRQQDAKAQQSLARLQTGSPTPLQ